MIKLASILGLWSVYMGCSRFLIRGHLGVIWGEILTIIKSAIQLKALHAPNLLKGITGSRLTQRMSTKRPKVKQRSLEVLTFEINQWYQSQPRKWNMRGDVCPLPRLRYWSLMKFGPLVPVNTFRHFQLFRKRFASQFQNVFMCALTASQIISILSTSTK